MKTWQEELKIAEKLLEQSLKHDLSTVSFYEGYIKGLKFITDIRKRDEEELIRIIREVEKSDEEIFWGNGEDRIKQLIKDYYKN